MGNRFYYGMPSTQAFQAMNTLDDDVQAQSAAATTAAQTAASSAAQAANARDAALAAWQASTAPNEQLAALGKQFHSGTIVDAFLYDTSRDSDGGAWRKRCKHTSWENEALPPGRWLGQYLLTTDAIAAGGQVGDYFQATGGGSIYYQIQSVSPPGVVPAYRGNTREFPALALIVIESARVVIYDATQPTLPMWMVFVNGVAWNTALIITSGNSACYAVNGKLYLAQNSNSQGVLAIDFIADRTISSTNVANFGGLDSTPLANRNLPGHTFLAGIGATGLPVIANIIVNDVVAAILPDAPIDPASGLPIPTVAVATNGGASILKHDGTVANWVTNVGWIRAITIDSRGWLCATGGDSVAYKSWFKYSIPTGTDNGFDSSYSQGTIPARPGADGSTGQVSALAATKSYRALGCFSASAPVPLYLYKENPASPAKAMVAFISTAYNSGWQVGDSRGAWLADTVAEVINSPELILNGTFDANTVGWTASAANLSVVNGMMRVTCDGSSSYGGALQEIATTPGKSYVFKVQIGTITNNTAFNVIARSGGQNLAIVTVAENASYTLYFTAIAASTTILFEALNDIDTIFDLDNVSVKQASQDRSANSAGLAINGSITKTAVAAGAQLVGYSGFSAANYLEQPYSANLDFGTGDFAIFAWVFPTGSGVFLLERGHNPNVSGDFSLTTDASGNLGAIYQGVATVTSTLNVPLNTWSLVGYMRRSGSGYLSVNGVQQNVNTGVTTNITSSGAVLRIGVNVPGTAAMVGKLALLRVSATAPSDDQIAQIYRDELALFQTGAQCTIDGTSSSVTAMAYDDTADILHVGTGWGRSAFHGLQRMESAVTSVGAVTALSTGQGAHMTGGAAGARYQQPAIVLRDEVRRKDSRGAGTRDAVPFDFDSTAGMTDFTLPPGWSVKDVLVGGVRKRLGATKDYTVIFDGYRDTVRFAASPGAAWVQVMAGRSGPG